MKIETVNNSAYEICLSKNFIEQKIMTNKKSFIDAALNSRKQILKKISELAKNQFGLSLSDWYESLDSKLVNDTIFYNNGILLINRTFKEIESNHLFFVRLQKPIALNKNLGEKIDIVFAIFIQDKIKTSSRLQILSKFSRVLKGNNFRDTIIGAKKPEDVIALLMPN
mgnify:CR=1 FL=1